MNHGSFLQIDLCSKEADLIKVFMALLFISCCQISADMDKTNQRPQSQNFFYRRT